MFQQKQIWTGVSYQTLYSYDGGVSWSTDIQDVKRRERARQIFGEYREEQKKKKQEEAGTYIPADTPKKPRKGLYGPVILPVTRLGSPVLGKDKGKNQKFRKNLRKRKESNTRLRMNLGSSHVHRIKAKKLSLKQDMSLFRTFAKLNHKVDTRKAHKHRCHGKLYVCKCDEPDRPNRPCGGTHCLRKTDGLVIIKSR